MSDEPRRPPLPWLLAELKEATLAELHARLAEQGFREIREGHGCVFRFIDAEGCRLTDLAERAGYTKQAVGEVVVDLEGLGYVERVADPLDKRAKIIRLTARGRQAQQVARRTFDDIERELAERVGEERLATVREVLEELVVLEAAPALPA
ncbi:MAG TPA: MarR family transcriptional regulator [Thermoleophilaceae bacterium]|nr:MarR family transcriptional regulator [Thermoleophilaceae bacterium]